MRRVRRSDAERKFAEWRQAKRSARKDEPREVMIHELRRLALAAMAAAAVRFSIPSLAYICSRCLSTVLGLRPRIYALSYPSASLPQRNYASRVGGSRCQLGPLRLGPRKT